MLALGGLIVLAGLWLVVTGLIARHELTQVRADVTRLRAAISAGELPAARRMAVDIASHAHRAHQLTTGPVWALAAELPAGGESLQTIRGVTASVDRLGNDVLPRLVSASRGLDPATLRHADGSFDLAAIARAAPELTRASAGISSAISTVGRLPQHTWLATIDSARQDVFGQLTSLDRTIRTADIAARVAPSMLGQQAPRSYLVSFETEAELRGTGGLPGAFAILKADRGKLTFTRFESDGTLSGVKSGLNFGPDYNQLYAGANATDEYPDSDVSPHFPYTAQIWTQMWRKYSGQRLAGAMVLDPTALSYLLQVTGPTTLSDHTQINATNVVALTQQSAYAKFALADQNGRKQYLLQIARAISRQLIGSTANTTALVRAAGRAAGERRLLAWSADPAVESVLTGTPLSGVVASTAAPFVGLSINNAAANKLDYYLSGAVRRTSRGCGRTRDVTVTVTLRNDAPLHLPAYVLGLTGRPGYPKRPGDNRLLVGYFASNGSHLTSAELNGAPTTSQIGAERGHPVYTMELALPRASTQTLVLHLTEPSSGAQPVVLRQPLVRPLTVTLEDARCA
ncbi:MAG: DUF4012 domain-containing protein [Jatrophihabitans sp.]